MEPDKAKKTPVSETDPKIYKPEAGIKKIEEKEIEENDIDTEPQDNEESKDNEGYVDFSKLF